MLEQRLIDLLRCPITKRPLLEADQQLLAALNAAIEQGQLTDQIGHTLTRRLDSALMDTQSEYAIPVFNGIPTLIPDEMIPLAQLDQPGTD